MRVIVIGATGHIGTYLVPRLVAEGHEVVTVSRQERKPYHESAAWDSVRQVRIDRARAERDGTFGRTIAELRPEAVVDLICFDVASASHLVEAVRGRVELFLHCGTLWVHGAPASCPVTESTPRQPFGNYGIRKAEIERFLLAEAVRGFRASVLHPGHITGPGWAPINPAGNLDVEVFQRLARAEEVVLPDEGLARLQHVHADDVAQAFALALAQPDRAVGEAFHVAASEPITMRAYAEAAASWFGQEARLRYLPWHQWQAAVSERAAEITLDHCLHSPCASIAKIESALGFQPRFSGPDAARDAVCWLEDQGAIASAQHHR